MAARTAPQPRPEASRRGVPTYAHSLFERAAILDPHAVFRALRDLGPVVWLPRHRAYAVTHFAEARAVLRADATFLSGRGVGLSRVINWGSARRAATLVSDGEQHDRLRRAVAAPLRPRGLGEIRKPLEEAARERVDALVGAGEFEAMRELASHLPTTIVAQMAGLLSRRRARMLDWSHAAFNVLAVLNARALRSLPAFGHFDRTMRRLRRADVRPGSWIDRLFDLREAGEIDAHELAGLIGDYIGPSLDTTIMATGHLLFRLARHQEAWEQLRAEPSLAAGAVAETLRIDSPAKLFTRCAAHDTEIAGHAIPAGARVAVVYAAANRDERRYAHPDRFDIERDARDHLAFGHGAHACVGAALAQLEMEALLRSLLERVERIEAGTPEIRRSNVLWGFDRLPMTLVPARA